MSGASETGVVGRVRCFADELMTWPDPSARASLYQPCQQRRDAEEAEETRDVGDGGENDRG